LSLTVTIFPLGGPMPCLSSRSSALIVCSLCLLGGILALVSSHSPSASLTMPPLSLWSSLPRTPHSSASFLFTSLSPLVATAIAAASLPCCFLLIRILSLLFPFFWQVYSFFRLQQPSIPLCFPRTALVSTYF
jgi:hypothetical protein